MKRLNRERTRDEHRATRKEQRVRQIFEDNPVPRARVEREGARSRETVSWLRQTCHISSSSSSSQCTWHTGTYRQVRVAVIVMAMQGRYRAHDGRRPGQLGKVLALAM